MVFYHNITEHHNPEDNLIQKSGQPKITCTSVWLVGNALFDVILIHLQTNYSLSGSDKQFGKINIFMEDYYKNVYHNLHFGTSDGIRELKYQCQATISKKF